jgi:hypothetical protein
MSANQPDIQQPGGSRECSGQLQSPQPEVDQTRYNLVLMGVMVVVRAV